LTAYQLRLPGFEGPLDLLLQLIERRRLDVTTVSLALVTNQYLEHLRAGSGVDPEQLSEFIDVAAKLLLIKSRALLPAPDRAAPGDPDPDDPTDLTERLREYEAFRRAAGHLRSREEAELRSYPHVPPAGPLVVRGDGQQGGEPSEADGPADAARRPGGLVLAFRRATDRQVRQAEAPVEVERQVWPVAEAIGWLLGTVRAGRASFRQLVAGFERSRLVACFLALLELHRQGRLEARQAEPFGEIELARGAGG